MDKEAFMKRIALLSCLALPLFFLALSRPASAEPCRTTPATPAALDFKALPAAGPVVLLTPAQPAPQALPSSPLDGRTDEVCFWYPTGQCCANGFQLEEWVCDPDLTRCGTRPC